MYVCVCHAVTDRTIREAARRGVDTLDQLAAETGAGTCCGSCRTLALQILSDTRCEPRSAFSGDWLPA
jgi:bacterioferritin-associated ferredoxin